MAGEEGIEPPTTVLETVVIPFNYSPIPGAMDIKSPGKDLFKPSIDDYFFRGNILSA